MHEDYVGAGDIKLALINTDGERHFSFQVAGVRRHYQVERNDPMMYPG